MYIPPSTALTGQTHAKPNYNNLTIEEGIELAIMIFGAGALIKTYYFGNTEHQETPTAPNINASHIIL